MKKTPPTTETDYGANDLPAQSEQKQFLVVGIGASAGGIQALQDFFANVPADSGIAYVVILHLSPDHDSRLAQVLQAVAKIPVTQVTEKVRVVPDHVYVVPPNQHLDMEDGHILVSLNTVIEERRAPVDIFFRSLAESHGDRAVAVVLSGTGANGSMGLKRIKERGGAAFVQNPREAEYNEMPRNSIATGLVDDVLPVAEIPTRIILYDKSLGTVEIPVEAELRPEDQQQALREIFTQLRARTGHDFSNYKRPTLLRRIERRINIRSLPSLSAYAAFLQQHPEETQALLKDLLISVTNFFRDQQAFEALEQEILPQVFKGKKSADQVRVWVAGCATGEEAYSMAMLCAERAVGLTDPPKIQIFATDIDETAIAVAREGVYTLNDAADVSPERLRRFFTKEGDAYRIRREIREMVLFASHNLIKDPPFSHLDLITCRNLLIYLNPVAQERVMETMHFALNPGGYLFLGTSESTEGAGDLFTPVSREHHIYQSRQVSSRPYPLPESVPRFHIETRMVTPVMKEGEPRPLERISYGDLHQRLLEQYAPPSVIINGEYDIVHLSERAGRYLQVAGGEPSNNLLNLIRQELRLELRAALYKAVQQRANVEARNLKVRIDERPEAVNIHVRPVLSDGDTSRGFLLVLFEPSAEPGPAKEKKLLEPEESMARHLEEELIRLKAQLRTSSEQHELQSEELKASNEELQAMNEELRSSAEELETSKEELQSINEELRTVNQELKVKVEEVSLTSNNLQNLVNSTDIATIFLDRSFRVQLFSPTARKVFNLIPADYGRPISDITHRLLYADLLKDAESVLDKLNTLEREVLTDNGHRYLMRLLPYRTAEDRINGVVITFVDITELKRAEGALHVSEARLRLMIESVKDYAIFTTDLSRRVSSWNSGAETMFGYTEAEILGQSGDILFVPEDRQKGAPEREATRAATEGRAENERWHSRKDGSIFYGSGAVTPLLDDTGKLTGFVKIMRDLTERKRVEDALRDSQVQLKASNEQLEIRVANRTAELTKTNGILQAEINERQQAEQERAQVLRRLVIAQEDERRRIAREMHDQFGQALTSLILKLGLLKAKWKDQAELCEQLEDLETLARQLDTDIDFLVWELRPTSLDDLGLELALRNYAENWSKHFGVPVEIHTSGLGQDRLSFEIETAFYRIAQEALNNIAKHAQAKNVNLLLERRASITSLIVEDDGKGFDKEKVSNENDRGLGLVGMRERAALLGGTIEVESQPGKGTTIIVNVPSPPPKKNRPLGKMKTMKTGQRKTESRQSLKTSAHSQNVAEPASSEQYCKNAAHTIHLPSELSSAPSPVVPVQYKGTPPSSTAAQLSDLPILPIPTTIFLTEEIHEQVTHRVSR